MNFSQNFRIASLLFVPSVVFACGPEKTNVIDADGDGVADSLGWAVDANGDGVPDQVDANNDGILDGIGVDTNRDYKIDSLGLDTDGDGIIDALDNNVNHISDQIDQQNASRSSGGASATSSGGAAVLGLGSAGSGLSSGGGSSVVSLPSGGSTSTPLGVGGNGTNNTDGGAITAVSGCANAEICDDFETGVNAGWVIQPNSTPAPVVDTEKAHSGASSLKVQGTSSQSFIAYPVPAQKFYARAFMNFQYDTSEINGHGWYIVAADNLTQGDESQIRFGSSSNHGHKELDMNVYASTCNGEKTQFSDGASDGAQGWNNTTTTPVLLTGNTWYCVEVMYDSIGNEAQVWLDGQELSGLHVTEQTMCPNWAPDVTHIKFGAGANSDVGAIWYDDLAVSTTPIGCD